MTATKAKRYSTQFEILIYFLKIGVLGFGGPFAVMATLQRDLVNNKKWIDGERFARALALIKALPGPMATQLVIFLGYVRGGRLGGLIAGSALILPSFVMMVLLAAFYGTIESLSWSKSLLFGMQAAAIGVIYESVWRLAKPFSKEPAFWTIAVLAGTLTHVKPSIEPIVIIGSGLLGVAMLRAREFFVLAPPLTLGGASASVIAKLLGVSFKAGAFVFGTGLAIVPLLAHDVVEVHHWLTKAQFMDALSFGQITPGPVVITVTFIGYRVAGLLGATLATFGIFAPAFFNILTWFPHAERKLGNSPATKRFVMWAIAAVSGAILVAVSKLALANSSPLSWSLTALALLLTLYTKLPVWIIIPLGGALSALVHALI